MSNQMIIERAKNAEMAHDFTTAARLYKELLQQDSTNVDYLSELGNIYVTAGEDKKAIPYFEQIHSFHPDNVNAMTSLGAIYRRLGRYEDSTAILQKALETGDDQMNVYYNLGFTLKEMKNYEDAVDAFENVISMNPRDVLTHNHLGSIYFETNELDKAVSAYKRGLQIDPNHPILNYNLARTYTKLKDYPEAVRCYETALKTRPNWPEAIKNFSNLLINCQQSEEAARIVKQSIKIHPNDPELLYTLGQVYLNQFDFENAQKTFKQADRIKGNDVKILTALASAYEKADESDKALETILSAMELEPLNNDARMQYVDTLLSVSDYDSAFKTLEAMESETKNSNVKVMDLYGQYYITQGKNQKAEEYYAQIRKKDHHYKNYLLGASKRYAQIENYDDAEKYAREYVKSRASHAEGYNMLGKIYMKGGRLDEASEILKKGASVVQPNVFAAKQAEKVILLQGAQGGSSGAGEGFDVGDGDAGVGGSEALVQQTDNLAEDVLTENAALESQNDFDVNSFGDDVGIDPSVDEMTAIENELEDDGEGLILPDEDEELSADELLDAIGSTESLEPENTLKAEGNDDFPADDAEVAPKGEQLPEVIDEVEPLVPLDEEYFGEGESAPGMAESAPAPAERELTPADVAQDAAESAPVATENEPAPKEAEQKPEPKIAREPYSSSSFELEALLNATKTAQEAMRLAQEAEKRVDDVEERQKQLEEEFQEEELQEEEDNPVENFVTVDDVIGIQESLSEGEPLTGEEELLSDENPAAEGNLSDEEIPSAVEVVEPESQSDEDFDAQFDAEIESNLSTTLFVSVEELYSELLSKIGDIDDADAAEKLSELAEKIEDGEITPKETEASESDNSDFKAPKEAPAVGTENAAKLAEVAEMLKKIEAILSDDDLALKYTKEISLLKHLKVLCEYLPNDDKIAFASGRIRMLIDYLLSKMSGRPGLLLTAQSLLKSGVLGEEYRVQLISDSEYELNNELIRHVLVYMKKLSESLEDFGLSAALRACADGALEKIEMENQKSQIF